MHKCSKQVTQTLNYFWASVLLGISRSPKLQSSVLRPSHTVFLFSNPKQKDREQQEYKEMKKQKQQRKKQKPKARQEEFTAERIAAHSREPQRSEILVAMILAVNSTWCGRRQIDFAAGMIAAHCE